MTTELSLTEAQALNDDDPKRQDGRRSDLLEFLMDGKWHINHDCAAVGGLSFNDSFLSLRQAGWIIESRRVKGGIWEFRLTGKNEEPSEDRPMTRPQQLIASSYAAAIREQLDDVAAAKVTAALPEWLRLPPEES
jgi:hypothetical protein